MPNYDDLFTGQTTQQEEAPAVTHFAQRKGPVPENAV